jgi:dinuclear metal center YbgI/SA1388 family protein
MINRDEITQVVEDILGQDLLAKARGLDVVANGVQFQGAEEVEKVALGVSLNLEFLQEATRAGANYCIFHHGFDPRTVGSIYSQSSQKRLAHIYQNSLTIAGYHYALDAHPEIGNNAVIAQRLGAKVTDTLFETWGCVAKLKEPKTLDELSKGCAELFSHDVLAIKSTSDPVQTLGIVSGGGKPYQENINEMLAKNVEVYISGESSESRLHAMQEEGVSYFLAGHYATEVFGVQELGLKLKAHFKDQLEVEFIDIPNPL